MTKQTTFQKISMYKLVAIIFIPLFLFKLSYGKINIFKEMQAQISGASEQIKDRVVHIEVITKHNQKTIKVEGSGLIIDSIGHIITNEHVTNKAEKITISVFGIEDKFEAVEIGTDKMTDLALLQMKSPIRFPPIKWADIKKVHVGDWAIAIGNPYGLDQTVSLGIISAKGRAVPTEGILNDFLQTDAMIDMGSSGGPLINLSGEILGINSMMMGRGIGFTVPSDVVQEIIEKLYKNGEIKRSWIGISIQPLSQDHAQYFGIPDKKGAIITGIFDKSPAQNSRLKVGNIITSINGEEINVEKKEDINRFKRAIANKNIGSNISLEVYDIKRKKTKIIKVKTSSQPTTKPKEIDVEWGIVVKEITPFLYRDNFLFTKNGVVVTYVRRGSEADIAGIDSWDVIQAVNDYPIKNIDDFKSAYKKVKNKKEIMVTVQRNRDSMYLLIQKYNK